MSEQCACPEPDSWFDRSLCPEPCGMMHTYCAECGLLLDRCAHYDKE